MRISFSTGIYYHMPLSYSLRLARDLGFDGVEWAVHPGYLLGGLEPVRLAFQHAGVPALSIHPPFYPFPGWPRRSSRITARLGALARHLGAEVFVVHSPLVPSLATPRAQSYAAAVDLGKLAGGNRVTPTIETSQYHGRHQTYFDDLRHLVEFCGAHNCGITFDTCHAGANGQDLIACYSIVKPLLRNIHLSDVRWKFGRPRTHALPGEGTLALAPFLATLARDGYGGLVTLETHPIRTGMHSHTAAVKRLGKALAFVRAAVAPEMAALAGEAPRWHTERT
ncbi:MAG TPA: sugar phosphate isomerase/epimerase [Ktedonobacterales bacterium]|nr:sugar phosphate isomerase/epimerase [Ktedonobacterales bacterium]